MKKAKFKVGDIVKRKDLPQYNGNSIIVTITAIDDEYYYCGHDDNGYVRLFQRSTEDQFEIYRQNLIKRILKFLRKKKGGIV
jgi:hypothetical protein